jgi:hypothetical protein
MQIPGGLLPKEVHRFFLPVDTILDLGIFWKSYSLLASWGSIILRDWQYWSQGALPVLTPGVKFLVSGSSICLWYFSSRKTESTLNFTHLKKQTIAWIVNTFKSTTREENNALAKGWELSLALLQVWPVFNVSPFLQTIPSSGIYSLSLSPNLSSHPAALEFYRFFLSTLTCVNSLPASHALLL